MAKREPLPLSTDMVHPGLCTYHSINLAYFHLYFTGDYWTTVAHDYKEVAIDTVVESRKRPGKACAYISCELSSVSSI